MTDTLSPGTITRVDPATLLTDVNVRTSVKADKDFVASLKEFGVLQPIVAVRTAGGDLRVKFGQRRTYGAIQAGLPTVPVLYAGQEGVGKDADVERILTQYAENEHRKGLTRSETVGVVEQLRLLDVTPAAIAKKTRLGPADVDHAIAVAGSELAKATHAKYDLTLDQAAAVAEFDDDADAVKGLVVAAKQGRFEHALIAARERRQQAQALAEFRAMHEAAGLRVIECPTWADAARAVGKLSTTDGEAVSLEDHQNCTGHVVWGDERWVLVKADGTEVDEDDTEDLNDDQDEADEDNWQRRVTAVYGCDDPAGHSHLVDGQIPRVNGRAVTPAGTTDEQRESAEQADRERKRQERREVITNNKAWDTATEVRREWVKGHLGARRKTPPAGSAAFVNHLLASDHYIIQYADTKVREYGWLPQDEAEWHKDASEARSQVVTLLLALAAHENHSGRDSWRNPQRWTKRYLLWLQEAGYPLADVERRAAGLPALDDASAAG